MYRGFSEFREPFLGGGSVFIRLKQLRPSALFRVGDLNYDLYCFWKILRDQPKTFIKEITYIKNTQTDGRRLFKTLRDTDEPRDDFQRAVRFYVLNRISYSGTVDTGGYSNEAFEKRFTFSNIDKLMLISTLLQDVEISDGSYEELLFKKGKEVFIYLDPPYWTSRKSKLYGKNGNLHTNFNHEKFSNDVRKCQHKWLITYDDSEEIRDFYDFANIISWELQYGMNNISGRKPSKGKEIIITNYELEQMQLVD